MKTYNQPSSYSTKTFFNLTPFPELSNFSFLFNKGLKHIPFPQDTTDHEIDRAFVKFYNSTLWKKHFYLQTRLLESETNPEDTDLNFEKRTIPPKKKDTIRPCPFATSSHIGFPSLLATLENMKIDINEYKTRNPAIKRQSPDVRTIRLLQKKYPSVIFKPADKNIGIVAMDITRYNDLVLAHLNDSSRYINEGNTIGRNRIINNRCYILYQEFTGQRSSHISYGFSNDELKYLKSFKTFKIPNFYVLPKLHKPGELKGRPIAGAVNWITTPISKILELKLQEFTNTLEFTLKNSQQLVDDLATTELTPSSRIITADVEALYPNMVLEYLYEMFQNDSRLYHLLPLVRFVCDNSYLQYNKQIYRQRKGIAMGTNCAVSLANIYMDKLIDQKIKSFMNPINTKFCLLGYKRYIDDLIFHTTGNPANFEYLKLSLAGSCLKLNYQEFNNNKAIFMDLEISSTLFDNKFHTAIFQKPLNKYMYLQPTSHHAPHTQRGFILGELTRYCRLSSDVFSYSLIKQAFYSRLINRGYKHAFLNSIFGRHKWTNRFQEERSRQAVLSLVIPYSKRKNQDSLERIFLSYEEDLRDHLPTYKPMFVHSTKSNIGKYLIQAEISADQSSMINR